MLRVALAPVWDCFGPAAKALAVGKELEARHHGCFYMMAHNQAALAEGLPEGRMTIGAVAKSRDMQAWLVEARPDVLVGFGGANALAEAQAAGIPTIAVVSLGWELTPEMRPTQWAVCLKADAVCLQRFGDWQPPAELNARLVDAIVDTSGERGAHNRVLVNVGGLKIGGGWGQDKLFWLASMADTLMRYEEMPLMIAGDGGALSAALGTLACHPARRIGQLTHREYLDTLAGANVLITVPGLTSIAEGYAYEVPTAIMRSPVKSHEGNAVKLQECNMLAQSIFRNIGDALEWAENAPSSVLSAVVERQGEIIQGWGTRGAEQIADVVEEVGRWHH